MTRRLRLLTVLSALSENRGRAAAISDQRAFPRAVRDSLERLRALPIVTERGARLVLSDLAQVRVTDARLSQG